MASALTSKTSPVQHKYRHQIVQFAKFVNGLKAHYDVAGIPSYVDIALSVFQEESSKNGKIFKDATFLSNLDQKKIEEYVQNTKLGRPSPPATPPQDDRPHLSSLRTSMTSWSVALQFDDACKQQKAFFRNFQNASEERDPKYPFTPTERKEKKQ
jgi:hypothetical protein